MSKTMEKVNWDDVAEYVAAGGIGGIVFDDNMSDIRLQIIYGNGTTGELAQVFISCSNCYYFDYRRRNDHEEYTSIILDAYLHKSSPLIDDLRACRLDSIAGNLYPYPVVGEVSVNHLEIIGEISVNVLCAEIAFMLERLEPQAPPPQSIGNSIIALPAENDL